MRKGWLKKWKQKYLGNKQNNYIIQIMMKYEQN